MHGDFKIDCTDEQWNQIVEVCHFSQASEPTDYFWYAFILSLNLVYISMFSTQEDSSARGMRTKSWPFWEDWKVIFGKDRATGANAEGVVEAARNGSEDASVTEIGESSDYYPSFDDFMGSEQVQATFGNNVVDDSSIHSG